MGQVWECGEYRVQVNEATPFCTTVEVYGIGEQPEGTLRHQEKYLSHDFACRCGESLSGKLKEAAAEGFDFRNGYFVHGDGRRVHVSYALDPDLSREGFMRLLAAGERVKIER